MSEENKEKKAGEPAEAPKAGAPKDEAPKEEAAKTDVPKAETPKAETPKEEAPKTEAPKAEAPKAEVPKPEKKKEKPANCAVCNKPIKRKRHYYRNGKYFCTKRCWKTTVKKEDVKESAQDNKATDAKA